MRKIFSEMCMVCFANCRAAHDMRQACVACGQYKSSECACAAREQHVRAAAAWRAMACKRAVNGDIRPYARDSSKKVEKSASKGVDKCREVVYNNIRRLGNTGHGSIAQLGEHLPYKQRVTGSSPVVPTILNGQVVQSVRMPACHAGGRGFEPLLGRF